MYSLEECLTSFGALLGFVLLYVATVLSVGIALVSLSAVITLLLRGDK